MDELLLFTLTSPSLHFRQTGSFLQFTLTGSSLNPDGRAPTIYIDEPFTALQTDGLLLTTVYLTSSCYSHGRAHTTVYLMSSSQQLYSTAHADEPPSTVPKDELHSPPTIDDLSRKQDTQLKNQVNTRKSDDEGHRPNPTSPTYSNHTVGEPSQFKQNSIQNFNNAV